MVTRGWGQRDRVICCLMGTVSVRNDATDTEIDSDDGCTTMRMYSMLLNCALKNG